MDSHPLFTSAPTTAASALSFAEPLPAIPSRLSQPVKARSRDSPNSPFLTLFDIDSQDRPCSASAVSPSGDSSLDSGGLFNSSPSLDRGSSGGPSWSQIEDDPCDIKFTSQEPDTIPVGLKRGVRKAPPVVNPSPYSQTNPVYRGSQPNPPHSRFLEECRMVVREELLVHDVPLGNLKQLLIACARSLSENNLAEFDKLVEEARGAVSITGEPIERLGAYMVEALVARREGSGLNIYRTLRCREPEGKDLLSYMHTLYDICPYLKFGYMAANGAIAEACRTEQRIHIVDFMIAQGTQWMTLLQALATRPGGPPHVRITGIDDPVSKHAREAGLEAVGRRLAEVSKKFGIPVEFEGVPVFAPEITVEMLGVRPGDTLVVNFPLQLHHTPDESVDISNPRDGLLRLVKSLSPKLVTLVEQESNTNTTPFLTRFVETLNYYLAMFESIDELMPRDKRERINVEQHCLARDMVNIIACEGKDRAERHELLGKWKSRFSMAGFRQYPLSSYVNSVIKSLLGCYSPHYTLAETDGTLLLGWKDRFLVSASAWH
ncbi:hypothetical protein MLD38_022039 [Melastoma candidum]|uniref:Uncharacterized protein n=1 Tax=Melastoma candidum TaxID=119954 RepID=A0ACB9QI60_9MYRT|nr:hypothetical protein MLD38_022039 [Melastoma candidum]